MFFLRHVACLHQTIESAPASVLVDRIEQIISQTGRRGFHFVDEAAPPAALKALAKELLRRKYCNFLVDQYPL
jgi:hypothetical protein